MHRRTALTLLLAVAAAPAVAQPAARLLSEGSEIVFTTRQMGVPVEGRFTRFTAEVALDPRQPAAGRVALSIDTASARFGAAELDSEVPQPVWLSSAAFPQARFESTAIRAAGEGRFEVAGRLTIKGITRELVVPVTLAAAGAQTLASGRFALKRLDFKVGEGEWSDTSLLADEVQVRFRLRLDGLPLPR
jgi:polyisoprenoid-binding protein YceI